MSDQMSLDGILTDEKPAAPEAPPETQPNAETSPETPDKPPVERQQSRRQAHREKEAIADGKVRDPETGQFVSPKADAPDKTAKTEQPDKAAAGATTAADAKPGKPAEAPAAAPAQQQPQMTEKERAFLAAAQDERAKRQKAESELAQLRAAAQQPAAAPKQFWDDPEGALKAQRDEIMAAVAGTRIQTAETIARGRYQDFDEKLQVFGQIAQANPWLAQQVSNSADPAEAAYRIGKNALELQQIGGIDQLRAKVEAETTAKVRAEMQAEAEAKAQAAAKERAALPGSLSNTRSTGANKPVWGGPTPLEGILSMK